MNLQGNAYKTGFKSVEITSVKSSLPSTYFRTGNMSAYRYGFNGMERDDEVKGNGNSYTTPFRQYDPRLGRWLTLDPLHHWRPFESPYAGFGNNPIYFVDPSGLTPTNDGDEVNTESNDSSIDGEPEKNEDLEEFEVKGDAPWWYDKLADKHGKNKVKITLKEIRFYTNGKDLTAFKGKFMGFFIMIKVNRWIKSKEKFSAKMEKSLKKSGFYKLMITSQFGEVLENDELPLNGWGPEEQESGDAIVDEDARFPEGGQPNLKYDGNYAIDRIYGYGEDSKEKAEAQKTTIFLWDIRKEFKYKKSGDPEHTLPGDTIWTFYRGDSVKIDKKQCCGMPNKRIKTFEKYEGY